MMQDAVDAVADTTTLFLRFDMDIAGSLKNSVGDDVIDDLNDVIPSFFGEVRLADDQVFVAWRRRAAQGKIDLVKTVRNGALDLPCWSDGGVDLTAEVPFQIPDGGRVGRIGHDERQHVSLLEGGEYTIPP